MSIDEYLLTFWSDIEAIKKEAETELECSYEKEVDNEQDLEECFEYLQGIYSRKVGEDTAYIDYRIKNIIAREVEFNFCVCKPIAYEKVKMKICNLTEHIRSAPIKII